MDCPSQYNRQSGANHRVLRPKSELLHFPALTGHAGVPSFKLVKNGIGVVHPAGLYIGNATFDRRVKRSKATLALLHQPERIAQNFAGVAIAPTGKLSLNERLEVFTESVTV
jgi:hypothetical protein